MNIKKILQFLFVIAFFIFCLSGCGKDKITSGSEYPANDISELQISVDTWNLSVRAATDKNIRISFDGSVSDKDLEPATVMKDGILLVVQKSTDEEQKEKLALGKKGQVTLYVPSDCNIPIKINNGMGNVEIDSISSTELQLVNNAGYVTFSNLAADSLKISSASGDITVKDSDLTETEIITSSGYVQLNKVIFNSSEIATKSGEVNVSGVSPDTAISIQTGSGDINLSYKTAPTNLNFGIASGSKDITTHFDKATYVIETTECRQGTIGSGEYELIVNSDSGTIVIK